VKICLNTDNIINNTTTIIYMVEKKHCYRCGHDWDYKGNAENPTCPSCGYKIFNKINKGGSDEKSD